MHITYTPAPTYRIVTLFCAFFVAIGASTFSQFSFSANHKSDCAFWTAQFAQYNGARKNVYKGECKNGQAHGNGAVYSYERIHHNKNESARDIYRGSFRKGVYFKNAPYEGKLLFDGRAIATLLGNVNDSEVWLHTAVAEDEPVVICNANLINIATDNYTPYIDDDEKAKALILEALALYVTHCPKTSLDIKTAIVEKKYALSPDIVEATVYAKVNLKKQEPFLAYSNFLLDQRQFELEHLEKKAQKEAAQANVRKKLLQFLDQHATHQWVSVESLSKNAFLWENKTIAVAVSLQNMLTRNTAIVSSTEATFERAFLSGIEPEYFTTNDLFIVVKVSGKTEINGQIYTHLEHIAHYVCESEKCYDLKFAEIDKFFDQL